MAATRDEGGAPRAVIHKRILDVASERPDAAMSEIADAVGGASVDLVERVLEEYGDPGELDDGEGAVAEDGAEGDDGSTVDRDGEGSDQPAGAATGDDEPRTDDSTETDGQLDSAHGEGGEFTAKQREVLEAVYAHPDASQRELGERLGVSASTVNSRLADVEGFAWDDRWRFVRGRFAEATDGGVAAADAAALSALRERVESLEARLEEVTARGGGSAEGAPPLPPALAHKVAHACLASDRLDEDEELAVLRALMGGAE